MRIGFIRGQGRDLALIGIFIGEREHFWGKGKGEEKRVLGFFFLIGV